LFEIDKNGVEEVGLNFAYMFVPVRIGCSVWVGGKELYELQFLLLFFSD
jgi:hypothetical protein